MSRRIAVLLSVACCVVVWLPATPGVASPVTPAPTAVTVSWVDGPDGRAVQVTWSESPPGTLANRVCQDGDTTGYCVDTAAGTPDSVLMDPQRFAGSASTNVGVQVSGAAPSPFAYSASFDTQRIGAPTLTRLEPWVDGRLRIAWTAGATPTDVTPGDPLDVPPPSPAQYRQAFYNGDFFTYGPILTTPGVVTNAPDGMLVFVVAVNEWGFISPGVEQGNVWDTTVHATVPTTSTYGQTYVVTGTITSDPWSCYGHPPACGPLSGPPAYHSTPSAGRKVYLQARSGPGGAWSTVDSAISASNGAFRLAVRSPGTRDYRLEVLGVFKPPSADAKAAELTAPVRAVARNRVVSARFDDPYIAVGQHVTARLTMAVHSSVRSTLQRWTGSSWVDVKWVYLSEGTGSYTFTATRRGVVGWRFVIPATTSPEGYPVAGTSSGPFYYKAS
jgi:hypothetical protein